MTEEQIKQIKERVFHENKGIYFSRVPEKEWTWFKGYADNEWASDYGMALAGIIKGIAPPENTVIMQEVEKLKEQIKEIQIKLLLIETTKKEEKPKGIKLLNGKPIIRIGEKVKT